MAFMNSICHFDKLLKRPWIGFFFLNETYWSKEKKRHNYWLLIRKNKIIPLITESLETIHCNRTANELPFILNVKKITFCTY